MKMSKYFEIRHIEGNIAKTAGRYKKQVNAANMYIT